MLEQKQLTDGTPITGARVLFLEPWMAHSEKRPLLGINVSVYYDDASTGEKVQVRE